MATAAPRSTLRSLMACLALAGLVVACSSGGSSPPSVASPSASSSAVASRSAPPSASPSAAPSTSPAPATFTLTVTGDKNVTGIWTSSFGIACAGPTFTGTDITFFATSPDTKAVVLVTLSPGSIGVSERAGSGTGYTDREFQGSGVTTFDAAKGAAFSSDLTVVPAPGQKPGILGTIKHVTGTVDCAGQTAGTSTLTFSGSSAEGAISGPFSSFKVICNVSASGNSVSAGGIINAGTTPTAMGVNLAPTNSSIFSYLATSSVQHLYDIAPSGTITMAANAAHVDADFVERLASGATGTPHIIHVTGDVTCGSTKTY